MAKLRQSPEDEAHQTGDRNIRIGCLKLLFIYATIICFVVPILIVLNTEPSISSTSAFWRAIRGVILQDEGPQILVWNNFFSRPDWLPSYSRLHCQRICKITYHRNDLNNSDAVLFHVRDINISDLPPSRVDGQIWALLNMESPLHTPAEVYSALNGRINWTIDYTTVAHVNAPYGKLERRNRYHKALDESLYQKKYFACWIVSNCHTSSHREKYVDRLKKYVAVKIFGKCPGGEPCPTSNALNCYHHISKSCTFYLAFENSLCKDYVTEKLFYSLKVGMIPVVMGGANYKNLLPAGSYVDVTDFPDARDLARHLIEVSKNVAKYKSYLKWKSSYEVVDTSYKYICDMCDKLHEPKTRQKIASPKNLLERWKQATRCLSWDEYFNVSSI